MSAIQIEQSVYYSPRKIAATQQDLMPGRYPLSIQVLSILAFTLAFVGWLNETWLFWFENPIWLNRYTEYAIILGFGVWRIAAEKNSYTRKRLIILVFMVTVFWWLIPWLYPFYEPYVGFLWVQPVFPSLHVPGAITFFLILALVFLFGRRIVCGFNCPCVGIRETVGFAFRDRTLRSKWTWRLRHSKWFFFSYYVGVMVVTQFPPNSWTVSFVGSFYLIVAMTYFGTLFIAPIVGNRFYCRYLCPFGATFGLLNHAGYYGIDMDTDKCIDCQRCEQVCDMGIPVWEQGKESGRVTALEDCMGCARCVVSCPTDALEIKDVRNVFNKSLVQNASHLLNKNRPVDIQRQEPEYKPVTERAKDWSEINKTPELIMIQAQANRCLDCGFPGCMNACPLNNRIPEWLEQVAHGNIKQAAEIAHTTSNLPEICGTLCPQHRLCEGACTKAKEPGGAVTIGAIERYLVNAALENNWQPQLNIKRNDKFNNERVAIIGAGPAGLACADELNKAGCEVTVFDKNKRIGGLLSSGVPPFKLDKAMLKRRHQLLEQQGILFQMNSEIDESMMCSLVTNYDAVFLGTGAQVSHDLRLSGQHLKGVVNTISYLAEVNEGHSGSAIVNNVATDKSMVGEPMEDQRVVVLGGGDSAMDCARSAVRQGADKVTVVYRGSEAAMRASPKERMAAVEEGVQFMFEHAPVSVKGDESVEAMIFRDSSGAEKTIDCERVILAVGQVNRPQRWMTRLGIETDNNGVVRVDENRMTSLEKVFAGGDNTNGPDLVVTAVVSGRKAAQGILNSFRPGFLTGRLALHSRTAQSQQEQPVMHAARNYP